MVKKFLTAALLTVCTATANAGVISQKFWFGDDTTTTAQELVVSSVDGTNIGALELNWGPLSFFFELFDDLGGTRILNSVELKLTGTSTGSISGTNVGTNAADISLNLGANLTVSGFGGTIDLVTVFPEYSETFLNVANGATVSSGNVSPDASNTEVYTSTGAHPLSAAIFNSFIGTGNGSIEIDASGVANAGAGGSGSIVYENSADGILEIVYKYTDVNAVSEPGYLAMLGLFLMTVARVRRS